MEALYQEHKRSTRMKEPQGAGEHHMTTTRRQGSAWARYVLMCLRKTGSGRDVVLRVRGSSCSQNSVVSVTYHEQHARIVRSALAASAASNIANIYDLAQPSTTRPQEPIRRIDAHFGQLSVLVVRRAGSERSDAVLEVGRVWADWEPD